MVRAKKAPSTSSKKTVKNTAVAEPINHTATISEIAAVAPAASNGAGEELIRERAYQYYLERGRVHGHDLDDWLRAEAEMTQRKSKFHVA